ncbi:MAG: hypothetical protein QXV32_06145 [Conexivisphaerales archaeon]
MKSSKLSFWEATAVGLGNIVGAGIFVMAGSLRAPFPYPYFLIAALLNLFSISSLMIIFRLSTKMIST